MKTKSIVLVMVVILLWAGNAMGLSFEWIELSSDNREEGWYLQTSLALNDSASPVVEYSWDGVNFYPMEYSTWGWYEFYNDNVSDRSGIEPPTDFNNTTFTYRVTDGAETLEASGLVNTIRKIDMSTDVTIVKSGTHPILSWSNSDSNITYYRVRVLDETEELLWQDTLPYEEHPTYQILGFTFSPQKQYYLRLEARRDDALINTTGDSVPWFNNMNRSVVIIPYSFEGTDPDDTARVLNPGFEQGKNGWFMASTDGTDCSFEIDPDAYEGSKAARLTITDAGYCMLGNRATIPIRRSGTYSLTSFSKVVGDIDHLTLAVWKALDPDDNASIPVAFINPDIGGDTYEFNQLPVFLNAGEYIRLELGFENNGSGTSSVLFDSINLVNPMDYDSFDTAPLDADKWGALELVREIADGQLRLNVQGDGEQVSNRLHPLQKTNYLESAVVVEGESWADNGGSVGLEGLFYNMKRGPGSGKDYKGKKDEVLASNRIRLDNNGVLVATASVSRILNTEGTAGKILFSQDFATAINFETPYTLSVEYDDANSRIIFKCNTDEQVFDIDTPEFPSGTDYRAIQSGVFAGGAGYLKTRIDDVYLQPGNVYDDFAGVLLDPARWEELALVRETDDGKLRLNIQGQDVQTDNTLTPQKHDLSNFEATVNVSSNSWVSAGASGIIRVAGFYYNDSRDGKKRPHKGYKGDVFAQTKISLDEYGQLIASCSLFRIDTPDVLGPGTVLYANTFNTEINFDTPYILGIEMIGKTIYFRCNDEYYPYEITGNRYPPSEIYRQIKSRVYADEGESGYMQVDIEAVAASFRKITLLSPDGGEVIEAGDCTSFKWGAPKNASTFKLKFSSNNGKNWETLAINLSGNSHDICVDPQERNLGKCLVKVIGYDADGSKIGSDTSDEPFAIEVLKLTSPDGGEIFASGGLHEVSWITHETQYDVDTVNISCSTNGGASWKLLETVSGNPGSANCAFPKVRKNKNNCLVKVQLNDHAGNRTGSDVSDTPFKIEVLKLNSPNGGEWLKSGQHYSIEWDTFETAKNVAKVMLKYTKNGGRTWEKIKNINGSNPGSYSWAIPALPNTKSKCKVKVELFDINAKSLGKDFSDGYFKIGP